MTATIFDPTPCELGEGPFWHPERHQFFWCDILGRKVLTRTDDTTSDWSFPGHVSALGWTDLDHLLVASETGLHHLDLNSGNYDDVAALEAENPITRSNDGRADPQGGFWIGTMGKRAEPRAGAIYRYYRGEIRKLYSDITIPNSIAFAPDGTTAFFTDSRSNIIQRQRLDDEGWPNGAAEPFVDCTALPGTPDGSVVDAEGNLWNAQWGGWRVACYSPEGLYLKEVTFNAAHTSCPAFGGPDLTTLFCTSARENLSDADLARSDDHGKTFWRKNVAKGQAEHRVVL